MNGFMHTWSQVEPAAREAFTIYGTAIALTFLIGSCFWVATRLRAQPSDYSFLGLALMGAAACGTVAALPALALILTSIPHQ